MTTTTTLYRFFDIDGRLLYVGISTKPWNRFMQHRAFKAWWEDAERIHLEHFPTRKAAEKAELHAIKTEKPLFNIVGQKSSGPWSKEFEFILRAEPRVWQLMARVLSWDDEDAPDCPRAMRWWRIRPILEEEDADIREADPLDYLEDDIRQLVGDRRGRVPHAGAGTLSFGDVVDHLRDAVDAAEPLSSIESLLRSEGAVFIVRSELDDMLPWCIPGCCYAGRDYEAQYVKQRRYRARVLDTLALAPVPLFPLGRNRRA